MASNQGKLIPTRTEDKQRQTTHTSVALARVAVDAAIEKKASNVVVLSMKEVSGVADYFVLCSADTELQIRAIVDNVRASVKSTLGESPWHKEGDDHWQWVVLDYVDVVVHVMSPERRAFYGLERLWGDAEYENVDDSMSAADVELLKK